MCFDHSLKPLLEKCGEEIVRAVEYHGEYKVAYENNRVANYHAICCCPPDSSSASLGRHASIAGNGNDDNSENKCFDNATKKIEICNMNRKRIYKSCTGHFVIIHSNDITPYDPHHRTKNC